jgi:hypothetical protein
LFHLLSLGRAARKHHQQRTDEHSLYSFNFK